MPIFIAFDLEATGLINPDLDDPNYQPEIIEIGAIKWGAKKPSTLSLLVKPQKPIPDLITKITNISNADVKTAKSFLGNFDEVSEFFTGVDHLVSFNGAGYDLPVMMYNLRKYGLQYQFPWPRYHTDLMTASAHALNLQGKTGNKVPKLMELYQHLFNEEFDNAHRAIDDAKATQRCYIEVAKRGII